MHVAALMVSNVAVAVSGSSTRSSSKCRSECSRPDAGPQRGTACLAFQELAGVAAQVGTAGVDSPWAGSWKSQADQGQVYSDMPSMELSQYKDCICSLAVGLCSSQHSSCWLSLNWKLAASSRPRSGFVVHEFEVQSFAQICADLQTKQRNNEGTEDATTSFVRLDAHAQKLFPVETTIALCLSTFPCLQISCEINLILACKHVQSAKLLTAAYMIVFASTTLQA